MAACKASVIGRLACGARVLGITGWFRNRMDESAEVMLQGSSEQLAKLCHWLRDGMSAAIVDKLEATEVQLPFPRFAHFDRLATL